MANEKKFLNVKSMTSMISGRINLANNQKIDLYRAYNLFWSVGYSCKYEPDTGWKCLVLNMGEHVKANIFSDGKVQIFGIRNEKETMKLFNKITKNHLLKCVSRSSVG